MTIEEIKKLLTKCWSKDTCYPECKENWTNKNPSLGQCAITSLIINDYFGGKIGKCYVNKISHYFNIIDNEIIDLTKEQFEFVPNYKDIVIKKREEVLSDKNTKIRYEKLKNKLKEKIYDKN